MKIKGFILAFIASATYGLNPLFALPLMAVGMDPVSILLFRYLLAVPIVGLIMVARKKSLRVTLAEAGILAVLGILVGVSSLTLFESYRYMDAGIASTLLFVYPVMVALIMMMFFREKVRAVTVISLAMTLLGIGLLYKGEGGVTLSAVGTLLVMGSALSYALYIVGVNRTRASRIPTLTVTFYVLLFGMLVFAADIFADPSSMTMPHGWEGWGGVLALALLPTVISFFCTTMAINTIGSTPTAILGSMEPVTAVVIGITVFGETLTGRDVAGLLLILVAVTLVVAGGSIARPLLAIRKLFPVGMNRKLRK